jgi:hypothetical protein
MSCILHSPMRARHGTASRSNRFSYLFVSDFHNERECYRSASINYIVLCSSTAEMTSERVAMLLFLIMKCLRARIVYFTTEWKFPPDFLKNKYAYWKVFYRNTAVKGKNRQRSFAKQKNELQKVQLVRKLLQVQKQEHHDLKFSLRSLALNFLDIISHKFKDRNL